MFEGNVYFYVYEGSMYWGRYGNMATQRNVYSWIFRNKPVRLDRWYISGPNKFYVSRHPVSGNWYLTIGYNDGVPSTYRLRPERMYLVRNATSLQEIDSHAVMYRDTNNAFRNRLREYHGKYFLPFYKHAQCV